MRTSWIALMPMVLVACGDDSGGGGDTASDVQADTGGDTTAADTTPADTTPADTTPADTTPADTTPPGASLAFQFYDFIQEAGVPGVAVAWTPPGGPRTETVADADGRVVLHGIDWSKGEGVIVGLVAGHIIHGAVVSEAILDDPFVAKNAQGDVILSMPALEPDLITVTGSATGMENEGRNLVVATDIPGGSVSQRQGTKFALTVPPDRAFNWAAFEWGPNGQYAEREIDNYIAKWAGGSSPGGAVDYTLALDFGTQSLAPESVEGTFPLFSSDRTKLDDDGFSRVAVFAHAADIIGLIGVVTSSSIAEGAVSYRVEWVEPEWADAPATNYTLQDQNEFASVLQAGYPTAGSHDVTLPVPATWTGTTTGARPIDEPLTWTDEEPDAWVNVLVYFGTGPQAPIGAFFNLAPGTTSFTLPELPGGYDVFEDGGYGLISASLSLCKIDRAISERACARYATSKRLSIGPAD